jgi:hypothetical protein
LQPGGTAVVASLLVMQQTLNEEKRSKYFKKERARDRKLLPDLIDKLNHAKDVAVTSGFKYHDYNWRFYVADRS